MSGFDFGALRDPDAPIPGARQREGVEMRARELETRARRGRMLVTALALIAVVIGVAGVVAATRDNSPRISVTNHGTTTTAPTSSTKPGVVASSTSTTTTTTPTNNPAVSASFVSPQRGWVLQRGGAVAETTDGGMTWKTLGSVGPVAENYSNPQIRFADAARGFVHTDRNFFTTVDGGAHWHRLDTPFGRIVDLAISHGVVYLVAYEEKPNNFALWSSPVDQLAWSKDALTLPIGAGPVPVQQLVFSGGNGWVINEDRTVIGGARLSATGHWVRWKPPCLDVVGPTRLAASSSADLVASCHEHEWGGGTIASAVYFSHDGGQTFQRGAAPAFGEIASPSPTTAVIAANGELRRTTDEGASWAVVARGQRADNALDLGFTTPTQGFVIFGDGTMLMTYDAGATWSAVTLP